MKEIRLLPIVVLLFCGFAAPADNPPKQTPVPRRVLAVDTPNTWMTDFNAAEMQAQQTGMPLLILFTCSDGDPVCIKLRDTIIDRGLFKNLIAPRAAKLYVDFPKKRKLLPQDLKTNNQLKAKYKITKLPTTIVIGVGGNSNGKEVMRIVGCPPDYVRRLQRVIR